MRTYQDLLQTPHDEALFAHHCRSRLAVVDPRFVKPLDRELLCAEAARTGVVVTVEENVLPAIIEGFAVFAFVFALVLFVAIGALVTLLYTIINSAFGLTAVINEVEPEEVVVMAGADPGTTSLENLDLDRLVGVLEANISRGAGRRIEREQRFYEDRLVFESEAKWAEVCDPKDFASR